MCGLQCWREGCGEMGNSEFNYNTRNAITNRRGEELKKRTARLTGEDKRIAEDLAASGQYCFDPQSKEAVSYTHLDVYKRQEWTRREVERQCGVPVLRIPFSADAFQIDRSTMRWFEGIL